MTTEEKQLIVSIADALRRHLEEAKRLARGSVLPHLESVESELDALYLVVDPARRINPNQLSLLSNIPVKDGNGVISMLHDAAAREFMATGRSPKRGRVCPAFWRLLVTHLMGPGRMLPEPVSSSVVDRDKITMWVSTGEVVVSCDRTLNNGQLVVECDP